MQHDNEELLRRSLEVPFSGPWTRREVGNYVRDLHDRSWVTPAQIGELCLPLAVRQ